MEAAGLCTSAQELAQCAHIVGFSYRGPHHHRRAWGYVTLSKGCSGTLLPIISQASTLGLLGGSGGLVRVLSSGSGRLSKQTNK